MRITDAAEPLAAGDDELRMRTDADLKPCVMTSEMRFDERGING